MKINFAHICEKAFLSSEGKVNILGVFNDIFSKSKPALHSQSYVVFSFTPEDKESHSLKVIIKSPSGEEVLELYNSKTNPAIDSKSSLGFIFEIKNLILKEEGTYSINFFVDNDINHSINFNFKLKK